jgi:hypothetical protein|tara:strand:+ start:387 stop:539 length:153 start_codon:yes stop_codon:yes gene_type:complete
VVEVLVEQVLQELYHVVVQEVLVVLVHQVQLLDQMFVMQVEVVLELQVVL